MKQKMSPGRLLSMAGLLVCCGMLLCNGLELIPLSVFRLGTLVAVILEVIAVIVIRKTNTF